MVNDYIEVRDAKIYNLGFDINVYVNDISNNSIINNIITEIRDFLDIRKNVMNTDVFLGKLEKRVMDVNGVIQVLDFKVYNKYGEGYSNNVIGQTITNTNTGELLLTDNTISSDVDSMFEIKYPERDIRVFLRKR